MKLYKKKKRKGIIAAVIIFLVGALYFIYNFHSVRKNVDNENTDAVKSAIDSAVISCYAIEGSYPSDIEYLEENYGITIDREKYTVEYEILGSNIKPTVKVTGTGGEAVEN